ncbi:right-handed parallel beta-helix repeat-containing protein [Actomonas aquatica]|uniref:Right-handed parallel beta-helix repeat-containing protein n=1 Tax=Actomonas aquatica TaxID=2866162 RepID=A0ABZ1C339_9BACT|nr:right-handed parallel beta-helix repeat-containing protein [Opitutus sp. WL0086]WRQ85742.1 right-handed parallel beta-helix repeat-containing protein [Opitutus sp. WL0086]
MILSGILGRGWLARLAGGVLLVALSAGLVRATPQAVPTFENIGLYWRPAEGAADRTCAVSYRAVGDADWCEAMPLWFDAMEHPERPERSREYRGSLVGLTPGTAYEIRLKLLPDGPEVRLETQTWAERWPVAKTVELPALSHETLVISEGGSAESGYVVYTSPAGTRSRIDGRNEAEVNIRIDAPYVIVRGLDLVGARRHGIELGTVQHVVIEDCDISGWGQDLEDGWGRNFDSAIYHRVEDDAPRVLRRIVIQRNRLHHPRANANSWLQPRASRKGSKHPIGPQAISFINADGEIVIRHNDIYSDFEHMFNDAMGEYHNFGYAGFPGRDSDIHGNRISHCWDDGIEMEGANQNVRCWGNVIDWTYVGIGAATTSLGPAYIYRNIYLHSRRGPGTDEESYKGQLFLKLGADPRQAEFAHGRTYVLHNTVLQPEPWGGFDATSGATGGVRLSAANKHQTQIFSRNNVLWTRMDRNIAVFDGQASPTNDFDYDLFNGLVRAVDGSETHGVHAVPVFAAPLDAERSWSVALAPGTPGSDQGVRLPGFNDDFAGDGPDMGAIEFGRPLTDDFPARPDRPSDAP